VSALDVLDGRIAPRSFAGKVVVIGKIQRGVDVHRTPLDKGRGMAGPELQANAIDTILRGVPLRDASWMVDVLIILVLACAPALATLSRSRFAVPVAIVAPALLLLAVAQLAFNAGWIIPVVLPLAALAASAVAVGVLLAARALRRRRFAPVSSEPDDGLLSL
jgi:adenylate cyclase